jgi:hypothetical protein
VPKIDRKRARRQKEEGVSEEGKKRIRKERKKEGG